MSLSCDCSYEGEYWYIPTNNESLLQTSKRKRCVSCKNLIDKGSKCLKFKCFRHPSSDVEEKIFGDEVEIAPKYLCEKCGDIYSNLDAAGFCYYMGDDLRENLRDYWELTGFIPKNKEV